jgi:hypothetical protein
MSGELRERFMRWWLPFWYGPPCPHGNYGPRYSTASREWIESGRVLSCQDCRREFDKQWHETHCGKCGVVVAAASPATERTGSR